MRYVLRRIILAWRVLSTLKATASPDFAAETNSASLISFRLLVITEFLADWTNAFIRPPFFSFNFRRRIVHLACQSVFYPRPRQISEDRRICFCELRFS